MPDVAQTTITFAVPIPGFPGATEFAVEPWGGPGSPFSVLRCTQVDDLEFVVVSPHAFFPDYAPVIDDATVEAIGLTKPEDAMVLVILTLGARPQDATANLLGPIVVNIHTGQAAQAILNDRDLTTREPLVRT